MRVGVDRTKYAIQIPLPPKIDPTVSLMTVEDKPGVTYDEVGGAKDSLEKLREVVEVAPVASGAVFDAGDRSPEGRVVVWSSDAGKRYRHERWPTARTRVLSELLGRN